MPDYFHRPALYEDHDRWRRALEAREAAWEREAARQSAPRPRPAVVPLSPTPGLPLLARGLYTAPFLDRAGRHVLFAVDRQGRCLARAVVPDEASWGRVEAGLRGLLDAADPVPTLRIVRSA